MCWPSPDPRPFGVARLDPATYRRHPIHGEDRAWPETNCYTDLMVEMAHALGFDPVAMLPFTIAIDFEGDQWTFFKPATCELYELYGFDIQELAIARPLLEHVVEQVDQGRAVLVEVDSFHLPDTAGTAYRLEHSKTTIAVNRIDPDAGRMGYFHNAGYFELAGEDFQALMTPVTPATPGPGTGQVPGTGVGQVTRSHLSQVPVPYLAPVLPPYCEFVKWRRDFVPPRGGTLVGRSLEFARRHVERMPSSNPFPRFKARFEREMDALLCKKLCFHDYAFANLRQFGACYELASTWLRWLAGHGIASVEEPAAALQAIADGAKAFQFQLARAVNRGRALDTKPLDAMAVQWDIAMEPLRKRLA